MERTILVGHQDTEQGQDALALGEELSRLMGAEVVSSQVAGIPTDLSEETGDGSTANRPTDGQRNAVRHSRWLSNFTVKSRSASQALRALAVETQAVAIVLGSSRWSTIGRLTPGSTVEQLLHTAPCPVAVAPRGFASDGGRRILRIAVGFDGSAPATVALDVGIAMAQGSYAELTVLTCVEGAAPGYASPGGAAPTVSPTHAEGTMRKVLEAGLARVPGGLPVRSKLLHGDPGMTLAHESADFDLMLVGARDYGPVRRMLLGSASRRLFRSGACAAMAVPTGVTAEEIIGAPVASVGR